jgi:predicted RNA binding protein YcfA (HicA-like mRNA interferase family)
MIIYEAMRPLDSLSRYRYISRMKVSEIIKRIIADGWILARTKGDHRQYKHPAKPGLVTIAGHLSDEVDKGTLNSIMKQAGLKE